MKSLINALAASSHAVALTGAGISTLCGIPDFRGAGGLYSSSNVDAERIFDIAWFDRDPSIYYRAAKKLVYNLHAFSPGPVHKALKVLQDVGILKGIITQNIDMLHQRAGSNDVCEIHGSPIVHSCRKCARSIDFDRILQLIDANGGIEALGEKYIPHCECGGIFKPDITFFGEALPEQAYRSAIVLASRADILLVLGTSLRVFPAAGLPDLTLKSGGKLFIVNAQPTDFDIYSESTYDDLSVFASEIEAHFRC